jgi:hypothetical protein
VGAESERSKCELTECPTFVVSKYLHQLQQALPRVPPIPEDALRSLHAAQDYKGVVALIKKTMKIECRLVVAWVNSGATKGMEEAPAWIRTPDPMPIYGTKAFRELTLTMFLRKSKLEQWSHDQMAIVVAHELSHVVLNSIGHPLRGCEKAVDLTAMVLGFQRLYVSGSYKEQRLQNSKSSYQLGYLSPHEVQLADQILAPRAQRSTIKIDSTRRSMMLSVVVLLIVGAVIWTNFGSVFVSGIPHKQAVENQINTGIPQPPIGPEIQQPPENVIYDPVLIGGRVEAGKQTYIFKVGQNKIDIDAAALERDLRKTVCVDHWALIESKGIRVRVRDASNGSFTTFNVRSCP